jgi:hypothetical protein
MCASLELWIFAISVHQKSRVFVNFGENSDTEIFIVLRQYVQFHICSMRNGALYESTKKGIPGGRKS